MVILIYYIFGLVFLQGATIYIIEHGNQVQPQLEEEIMQMFGSVAHSMLTLYKVSTGGDDWSACYGVVAAIGPSLGALFLFFITFIQVALMNVITGIFVENAMKLAQPDKDSQILDLRREQHKTVEELRQLCREMDKDNTGTIVEEEFMQSIRTVRFREYLSLLGLNIKDATLFFEILSNANKGGPVAIDDFVDGCIRLQGSATSLDLQIIAFGTRLLHKKQHQLETLIFECLTKLEDRILALGRRPTNRANGCSRKPSEERCRAASSTASA